MTVAYKRVSKFRRDEKTKWPQQDKVKYVQKGGNNMKYFHLFANKKYRRTNITPTICNELFKFLLELFIFECGTI